MRTSGISVPYTSSVTPGSSVERSMGIFAA